MSPTELFTEPIVPAEHGELPYLPPEAFHGPAGEYALAVEPYTEASTVAILTTALIGYGNAIGRGAHLQVGGVAHHTNEGLLHVGPSATGRKGEGHSIGLRPIRLADPEWSKERVRGSYGSGEAIVADLDDNREDPDNRLLVLEGEFAAILAGAARDGSTVSIKYREGWDGVALASRVKDKTKTLYASNPHLSVITGITLDELVQRTTTTDVLNGFLNRFLLVAVKRSKLLPDPPLIPPTFDDEWADRFGVAIEWARREGSGRAARDDDATKLWRYLYTEILSVERYGLAGSACSRAAQHTLRLSLIYALLDRSPEIRSVHIQAAFALWKYCEATAMGMFGTLTGNPLADRLVDALESLETDPQEFKVSEINRAVFSGKRSSAEIRIACDVLARNGRVRMRTQETTGRKATFVELLK